LLKAKCKAVARPMPESAPVIKAVLFFIQFPFSTGAGQIQSSLQASPSQLLFQFRIIGITINEEAAMEIKLFQGKGSSSMPSR
jgi:hypothetical protein